MADPVKLDRYRTVRILGAGGMGTVSLAQDTVLGRQVALKRVTGTAGDTEMLRLRREALVGASVSHRNLVSIYDVEENDEGELVIVMEYVEGETLRDAVAREGGLPSAEALRILEGAAAGLDAIHAQGIVHRDVKPANVLLGRDGSVKVADLGIAAVADRTRITSSGAVMGSLSYMAPEQLHDTEATPAIDIYALGAVAYEVLSGQRARREANPVALAYAMDNKPPPDLREAWPQAPVAAAELLERTMAREPEGRPRSAGEFVSRLRAALDPTSTAEATPPATAPAAAARPRTPARTVPPPRSREPRSAPRAPDPKPERRRSWWPAAALLALVGIAAAAVLIATSGNSGTPPKRKTASHHWIQAARRRQPERELELELHRVGYVGRVERRILVVGAPRLGGGAEWQSRGRGKVVLHPGRRAQLPAGLGAGRSKLPGSARWLPGLPEHVCQRSIDHRQQPPHGQSVRQHGDGGDKDHVGAEHRNPALLGHGSAQRRCGNWRALARAPDPDRV